MSDLPFGEQPQPQRIRINTIAGGLEFTVDNGVTWTSAGASAAGWFAQEAAFHLSKVPGLTVAVPIQLGVSPINAIKGAALADAGAEGGALKSTGSIANLTAATIWQNPKTSKFGVSFYGTHAAIAAAQSSQCGAMAAGGSSSIIIETAQATDAVNFVGVCFDGAALSALVTLGPADNLVHTFCITGDGTTISFFKDHVLFGTILTSAAHVPTAANGPAFNSTAGATGQAFYQCLYSFVGA